MVSNSDIIKIANKYKAYVEKNKKTPASITLNSVKYTYYQCSYLFSKFIITPEKGISLPTIKAPGSISGNSISENILENDYKDMAKRLNAYIEKNKQAPIYVTTKKSKKKVSIKLCTYAFARIVSFFDSKKQMPNYVTVNSSALVSSTTVKKETTKETTSSIKKYGRSSKSGCDNRGQNTGYWCAPHMAQEIVRNLTGIVIPQSKIASIMGTTTSGTGHSGIDTFFAWFNKNYTKYHLDIVWKNFSDLGWSGVKKILESSNKDCGFHELYRRQWGHYTNFDKIYDSSIAVHNSLGSKCTSSCYCGYEETRSKSEAKSYLSGISQKSVLVVTRTK